MRDGVFPRLIGKRLNAGVLEGGSSLRPSSSTPQSGVILPRLANVLLHAVSNVGLEAEVKPRMHGGVFLVRCCDDFFTAFCRRDGAER